MKWPTAAGKTRISAVETLIAVTPVLVKDDHGMPDPAILRAALRRWAFNPAHRDDPMPLDIRVALSWIRRSSLPITALQDDKIVRQVLDALALKLDGTAPHRTTSAAAAASYTTSSNSRSASAA